MTKKKHLPWWAKLIIALLVIIIVLVAASYGTMRYFVGDSLSFKGTLAMVGYGGFDLPEWFRKFVLDVDRSYPGLPTLPSDPETYDADRAEMLRKYETYMYGEAPKTGFDTEFAVLSETDALGGKATKREVKITVSNGNGSHSVNMLLYLPKNAEKPGVFIGLNFSGNNSIESEWPVEHIVDSGFAVATMAYQDWVADSADAIGTGVLSLFPEYTTTAYTAWAFGILRGVDYLETLDEIDHSMIASVGHSRLARVSLWAGANDERISLVTGSCGGGLQRSDILGRITVDSPTDHWSTPAIYDYVGRDDEFPTDIHMLYALTAPRHLFISIGESDLASDPVGTWDAVQIAKTVWRDIFGMGVIPDGDYYDISAGASVTSESLGVNVHKGAHTFSTEDWDAYIAYINEYLK